MDIVADNGSLEPELLPEGLEPAPGLEAAVTRGAFIASGPQAADETEDATDKDGGKLLTLEELDEANLLEMSKDKLKSRQLQRSLTRGSPEVRKRIYETAEPFFMELVRDQYGNYLAQKLMEVSDEEQFEKTFALLKTQLRELSEDIHATRAVQKAIEQSVSRGRMQELLEALPGDVTVPLARNIAGFHVVVKLVETLPTREAGGAGEQEALLELLFGDAEKVRSLGCDQWGCCVLKKCIDKSEGDMKQRIIENICANSLTMVQDPFGNYVVQHFILAGNSRPPNANSTKVIDSLKGRIFELSLEKFSSPVLEKCLLYSADKDRNKIINELLSPEMHKPSEAIKMLIFHQYGNFVFQQALDVAKEPLFSLLVELAKPHIHEILATEDISDASKEPKVLNSKVSNSLAPEHARRLAVKLGKRYPVLSLQGEQGQQLLDMSWALDNQYFDPSYGGFSIDAFGPPMPGVDWDASGYGFPFGAWGGGFGPCPPFGMPPLPKHRGKNSGKSGRGRGGGPPRDRDAGRGNQASFDEAAIAALGEFAGGNTEVGYPEGAQTMPIGRVVGFWPNYEVVYDEVPLGPVQVKGGKGGKGKKKAKGKGKSKNEV